MGIKGTHSRAENVNFSVRIVLAKACITKITTMAGNRLKGTITDITPTWFYPSAMEFIPQTTQWGWSELNSSTAPSLLTPGTPEGKTPPAAFSLSVQSQLTQSEQEKTPNLSILQIPGRKADFSKGLKWAACSQLLPHTPCCVWAPVTSCSGARLHKGGWF